MQKLFTDHCPELEYASQPFSFLSGPTFRKGFFSKGVCMTKSLLVGCTFFLLTACVEVKNANQNQPAMEPAPEVVAEPALETQELSRFETNQPLYFWEGQFLDEQQWSEVRAQNQAPQKLDYEFVIDEMILGPNAILYTNGFNVRFHIGHLVSEEALIATFPTGQTAELGQPGRDGGKIIFNLKSQAQGFLRFEMRGENGGKGLTADGPDASMAGVDGAFENTVCTQKGPFPRVVREATDGQQGRTGHPGFAGGATGTLEIIQPLTPDFLTGEDQIPGQGGPGGDGGGGGIGGLYPIYKCLPLFAGKRKETGPIGNTGPKGPDGAKDKVCKTIAGVRSC